MKRLTLKNIGQIKQADITFGDLTVIVGPQASGKSISLQWLKLMCDTGLVQRKLHTYGLDYDGDVGEFLDVYFGEGMRSIWSKDSAVAVDGKAIDLPRKLARQQVGNEESVFLIPAQRVMSLANGWPRPFTDYKAGDPFAVRSFSEALRQMMEREFRGEGPLFPRANRLKSGYRSLLQSSVFGNFSLSVDKVQSQKRLVLGQGGSKLPYMVWSAGQREFVPLLLGLYWLMPPAAVARRNGIEWVVIEEPEMGLHPRAISIVLLIVLELMQRGYKVCISTHSPQVLEMVWALDALRKNKGHPSDLLDLLGAPQSLKQVAKAAMTKRTKVYYFASGESTVDLSDLNVGSAQTVEATWGGLLEFSDRANDAVARAVSNSQVR